MKNKKTECLLREEDYQAILQKYGFKNKEEVEETYWKEINRQQFEKYREKLKNDSAKK